MNDPKALTSIDNRRDPRVALEGTVSVEFDGGAVRGSGQNISSLGVFFTVDGSVPVTVHIGGREKALRGELVRFEKMGEGRIGIAVRFLEPCADLPG